MLTEQMACEATGEQAARNGVPTGSPTGQRPPFIEPDPLPSPGSSQTKSRAERDLCRDRLPSQASETINVQKR
jgi:hypothetical protein